MGSSEKFCLKWNDFESNISSAFRDLREEKDFFDVTLACDDDSQIEAHKTILSACSPFFRSVLRRNPHQHPLLYLKGVKYKELQAVLDFMYMGEVNVAQEELNSFLAVAEDLRVKGLTQGNSDTNDKVKPKTESNSKSRTRDSTPSDSAPPPSKKSRTSTSTNNARQITAMAPPPVISQPTIASTASVADDDDDIQEVVPVKSEPNSANNSSISAIQHTPADDYEEATMIDPDTAMEDNYGDENYDYSTYDESYEEGGMMDPNTGMPLTTGADGNKDFLVQNCVKYTNPEDGRIYYSCKICKHSSKEKGNLNRHIEAKHMITAGLYCSYCNKSMPSLDTMDPTQYLAKITPDHGGTPYYQCTFCEYSTQYCTSAKRHIASKHVVLFSHKCSRCEKSFSTQNAYNQHMKRYCMNPNIVT